MHTSTLLNIPIVPNFSKIIVGVVKNSMKMIKTKFNSTDLIHTDMF